MKNQVHSLLDRNGFATGKFSDLFGEAGMEWLKAVELSTLDRLMLDNHLEGDPPCTRNVRKRF